MSGRMTRVALWVAAASFVVLSVSACYSARMEDGGIVGTGNRVDCEAYARKGGSPDSLPEECRRENLK